VGTGLVEPAFQMVFCCHRRQFILTEIADNTSHDGGSDIESFFFFVQAFATEPSSFFDILHRILAFWNTSSAPRVLVTIHTGIVFCVDPSATVVGTQLSFFLFLFLFVLVILLVIVLVDFCFIGTLEVVTVLSAVSGIHLDGLTILQIDFHHIPLDTPGLNLLLVL
jgi:hypothetical protein